MFFNAMINYFLVGMFIALRVRNVNTAMT